MTFTDYPGHLVAVFLVLASAAVTFVTFRSGALRTPERTKYRWPLMALHYATVLALLVVLWNPSAWQTKPIFGQNAVLAIFDTSESMSVIDDGRQARLDKALDSAAVNKWTVVSMEDDWKRIFGFDAIP